MSFIVRWLLCVLCASLIAGIISALPLKNSISSAVLKLLTGIFLAITLVSPWHSFEFQEIGDWYDSMYTETDEIITSGVLNSETARKEIIISRTEAYIQDKAADLNISTNAEVILSNDPPHVPVAVILTAEAAPYAKQQLQSIIAKELGIPREDQTWN